MRNKIQAIIQDHSQEQFQIFPIVLSGAGVLLLVLINSMNPQISLEEKWISWGTALIGFVYFFLLYEIVPIFINKWEVSKWVLTLINSSLVCLLIRLTDQTSLANLTLIISLLIIIAEAILSGRGPVYTFIAIVFSFYLVYKFPSFQTQSYLPWLDILTKPIIGMIATESILTLKKDVHEQLYRMEVLNKVARSLSSSLETPQVMALLTSAIQNVIEADTYFVGLLQDGALHLELIFDDGEFFPAKAVPLENTIAGWLIENQHQHSVLMNNVVSDTKRLGIPYSILGQKKTSKSWMGTLLESGGQILGLVAVASYQYNAFSQSDLELLQNVAQQASMAIDNAYHHAEVELQSTLDSLTGALNHGNLLKQLDHAAELAKISNRKVSLIMLDIDHFKRYNDTYGHLVGDQVLCELTSIMIQSIKSTDIVGRWGGEEFAIILPGASGEQALRVAQRIQDSLRSLTISGRNEEPIPAPTASMGIAVLPLDACNVQTLIDLADQRLYKAKERGRDEIEPAEDIWKK